MSTIEKCIRCGEEYHYEAEHMCPDLLVAAMLACMGGMPIPRLEDLPTTPRYRKHSRNGMKHDRAGGWTPKHPRNQKGRKR